VLLTFKSLIEKKSRFKYSRDVTIGLIAYRSLLDLETLCVADVSAFDVAYRSTRFGECSRY
jgi:hypothetical protein